MPDDFPVVEFTAFMAQARRVLLPQGQASPAWKELAGASNLIGWRFRASSDAWVELRTSIERHGDGAQHEELYRRERSLFVMFAAGASSIESTTYALGAAASHPNVLGIDFGTDEQRMCSPKNLHAWLISHPKAAAVVANLGELLAAPQWSLWIDLRNRMTHRSNLPRRLFGHFGSAPPPIKPLNYAATSSSPLIEADLTDFDALHRWLARAQQRLLASGTELLSGA